MAMHFLIQKIFISDWVKNNNTCKGGTACSLRKTQGKAILSYFIIQTKQLKPGRKTLNCLGIQKLTTLMIKVTF